MDEEQDFKSLDGRYDIRAKYRIETNSEKSKQTLSKLIKTCVDKIYLKSIETVDLIKKSTKDFLPVKLYESDLPLLDDELGYDIEKDERVIIKPGR